MKLYAKVESNRATKGQGGDFLNITLTDSNSDPIGNIFVRQKQDAFGDITYIDMDFEPQVYVNKHLWLDSKVISNYPSELDEKCEYCGEKMYTVVRAHHHTENGVDVTKGEKKKGEKVCEYHGVLNCSRCNPHLQ